jgi:hypothetical protein
MPKAAANTTSPVSLFHNLSTGELVDQFGHVKAEAAEVKAREDALRAELLARGVESAEGMLFRATITEATRWTLDSERIKAELGELWAVAHSKVSTVTTLRVTARTGARQAA